MAFSYTLTAEYFFAFFLLFGTVTILGGIQGYLNARSTASLVAGTISGVLLLLGAFLWHASFAKGGPALLLVISFALLGRFMPSLLKGKLNPALYIVPLSLVGTVLSLIILFGAKG